MKTTEKRKFLKEKDWEYCHNNNFDREFDGGLLTYKKRYYNEKLDKYEDTPSKGNKIISYSTVLFDAELDPFDVQVDCCGLIIDTEDYGNIVFDTNLINSIQQLWDDFKFELKMTRI